MIQIFVTGTGTGCGKTFVSYSLCGALAKTSYVIYHKPVETGGVHDSKKIASLKGVETAAGLSFKRAASPHLSAGLEKRKISCAELQKKIALLKKKPGSLIVEGAGGLMVPLNQNETILDLIKSSGLPVLLCARAGLGTINETLLSAAALKEKKIPLAAVILNIVDKERDPVIEKSNLIFLQNKLKAPVFLLDKKNGLEKTLHEITKILSKLNK